MPTMYKTTLNSWYKNTKTRKVETNNQQSKLQSAKYIYSGDEFTNYNDTEIGIKSHLFGKLGFEVEIPKHEGKGKGLVIQRPIHDAKKIINKTLRCLQPLVTAQTPF